MMAGNGEKMTEFGPENGVCERAQDFSKRQEEAVAVKVLAGKFLVEGQWGIECVCLAGSQG